jgi:alcohol dehydrogenase class IV
MAVKAFTFQTATEIVFGRGGAQTLAKRAAQIGARLLLVQGATAARSDWLADDLAREGCSVARFSVSHEPDLALVEHGIAAGRSHGADIVVALGGGSVIDAGKAIAALVPAQRPILDHLEVIGSGLPLEAQPLALIAAPTTAGAGAEVTRNAVISVPEHRRKVSLRDGRMLPRLAVVDPALTDNAPRALTLECGLDAITQLIEPYLSSRANRMADALCRDAIPSGLWALKHLMDYEDPGFRDQLAWSSLCGGLALANAGLGVVHGLAGPLGGLVDAPHGAICGALLVAGMEANRTAVTDPEILTRIDDVLDWIGMVFGGDRSSALSVFSTWLDAHGRRKLGQLGCGPDEMAMAADAAQGSSSMKANPVPLTRDQLMALMQASA